MMRDVIELVTTYKDGKDVKHKEVTLMAKAESVTRNEFYASYGVGLAPKYIFTIWPDDYKLADVTVNGTRYRATHIKYDGELHEIVRTYSKGKSAMQITVK